MLILVEIGVLVLCLSASTISEVLSEGTKAVSKFTSVRAVRSAMGLQHVC